MIVKQKTKTGGQSEGHSESQTKAELGKGGIEKLNDSLEDTQKETKERGGTTLMFYTFLNRMVRGITDRQKIKHR